MSYAALNGTKNIPGDYSTLAEAITDLNTQGVGYGGVVLNLLAGHPETAPIGGYSITTLTGTALSPITIQGNGNTITAYTPQAAGLLNDAIIKIIGGDYITIQGFTLQENPANTTFTAASNNATEFGIALFYASQTDGAKNITIQNNSISLNRTYQNSFGIYSNVRHSATVMTTAADITSPGGSNDNTHIYSNTISNVNNGISIVGSTTAANMNTGIDIGGNSSSTTNTISNYGSTGTFSAFVSVYAGITGIYVNNSLNTNVSYNSITCPGLNTAGTVFGLYWQSTGAAPTTGSAISNSITHNNFSIKNGLASGTVYGMRYDAGSALFSYDLSYNDFSNFGYTGTGTGNVYCLYSGAAGNSQNVTYNTFTNLSLNTTGTAYLLYVNGLVSIATSTQTVSNNSIVTGFSKTGAGGAVNLMYNAGASGVGNAVWANNNFSNITLTGATSLVMFTQNDGVTNKSLHDNSFTNIIAGTGAITGLNLANGNANVYNNTFSNITAGGAITVINNTSYDATTQNVYANTIHGISSSGSSAVYGIQSGVSTTGAVSNIYKNTIYDMSSGGTSSKLYGIYVSATVTTNIYNNFISDLRTPAANAANPLAGIWLASVAGTTNNVFYNTVYLSGSSSGAAFGSSALYTTTAPGLDLRNNILVNKSVPNGTGITVAFRRSTATLTTYSANSNANDFYAGSTEDATHAIYYDGSTPLTISAFKSLVTPIDAISFRELPPFINVVTTPFDLHLKTTVATLCESGAIQIIAPFTINDDIDGNTRTSTPDAGGDEFSGIAGGLVNPGSFTATAISSQQINVGFSPNTSGNNVILVWNNSGTFTIPSGTPPSVGTSFAGGTLLYNGVVSPVSHTALTPGTQYYYKAFSYDPASSMYSGGVTANATPFVAPPTSLTANTVSNTEIDLSYTLNAQSNNVLIATSSSSSFGVPINGTPYVAGNSIPSLGTVIYVGPLAGFNHTGLTEATGYYYAVWSVDAFNYYSASNITATATTYCNPVTSLPWHEGFEELTTVGANILPDCWAYQNISSYNYSCATTCNANTAHAGTNFIGGSWNFDIWDFTPGMQLVGGVSYDFSYWFKCTNTNIGYNITLAYGTTQTVASMTNVLNSEANVNIAAWTYRKFTFTPISSGVYFFGLHDICNGLPYGIAFDDFTLETTPSCDNPTSLTVPAVTTTGATLGWTSTASAWEYQVVLSGSTPAGTGTPTTINPTSFSGLNPNTSYDFYVRANCSGNYSGWAGPVTFTTLCGVLPTPFIEPFAASALPSCWTTDGPQVWNFQHYSPSPGYGASGVTDHSTGGTGNYAWVDGSGTPGLKGITLLSPTIDVSTLSIPRIRFYLFNNNITSTLPEDEQQLSMDVWDGSAWHNNVYTWAYGQNAVGWQEKIIPLNGYTSSGHVALRFIVEKGTGNPSYDDIIIDDVTIEETPLCPFPSSLTASPGNVFADLGWTPGGEEMNWDIEYGPAGFIPTGTPTITGVTNPYHLTALTPVTSYGYYVRANCGVNLSTWVGPKTFTTLIPCPQPLEPFVKNTTQTSAILNWSEPGTATSWSVEWGPEGFIQGSGTTISGITMKPYTLTGLTSGTRYDFYVQSECGEGGSSIWSGPVTFTTACDVISAYPWTEGFEGLAFTGPKVLPPCMTYENVIGTQGPTSTNLNTLYYGPHSGTNCVYTYLQNTTWIFSPAMNLTAGSSYDFSFWMQNKDIIVPVDFTMDVAYGASNNNAGMTHLLATGIPCTNSNYVQFKYTFTPSSSGTFYLGVKTSSSSPQEAVAFDDFRFEPTPACPLPANLTVSAIHSTEVSLGWTGATAVQFDYGTVGHPAGTGSVTASVSANPYTLGGLTPSASYDVFVRQDCGFGSFSPWFGPVQFTTLCTTTPAPFAQTFESQLFPPDCWSSDIVYGDYNWKHSSPASGYGNGNGSALAEFYIMSPGRKFELKTLPFDISGLANPTLKFDYAYGTYGAAMDSMDVYYSTNGGNSYTLLLAMPGGPTGILNTAGTVSGVFTPRAEQWATQNLALPSGTNMIKFKAISGGGNNLYLDNVAVYSQLGHDVAALSVGINDVIPQGTVIPTAMIRNDGTVTETFTVNMTIGAYTSTKTVTDLARGAAYQVTFSPWIETAGTYTAVVTATLSGDMNPANNLASKSVKVMNLNKLVYAYNTYANASPSPEGPISFNLSTPGTFTSIANQSPMGPIIGGTWANGLWYGTTVAPNKLLTINPATGARTFIGTQSVGINGLSYNSVNSTMYGISYDGVSNTQLYSINMATGANTYIGDCGARVLINMAINSAGQAYSLDIGSNTLGTIDLTTGAFTTIGPVGFDANYYQDMEFDHETGDLYMAANGNGSSWLAWVDITTGAALKVGEFEGDAEVTSFVIPYALNKTLNLSSVCLEGLYNGSGTMRQAYDENGPHFASPVADKITVELHSSSDYGTIVYSANNISLSTTGTAVILVPNTWNGSYYVTIRHRNSIETTTAAPVSFSAGVVNYAFDLPGKIFGGNILQMVDGHFVIYGGDNNQDGIVDGGDMAPIDNKSALFAAGYIPEDINGDGLIDGSDMAVADNNSAIFLTAQLP